MYAMLYAKQLVSYSHEPNIKNCEGIGGEERGARKLRGNTL